MPWRYRARQCHENIVHVNVMRISYVKQRRKPDYAVTSVCYAVTSVCYAATNVSYAATSVSYAVINVAASPSSTTILSPAAFATNRCTFRARFASFLRKRRFRGLFLPSWLCGLMLWELLLCEPEPREPEPPACSYSGKS